MARRAKNETAEATGGRTNESGITKSVGAKRTASANAAESAAAGGESGDAQELWADMTIEDMLDEVDGIIARLDSGEIPLEDSFKIYERGMKLVSGINTRIDKVEKKIIEIEARSGISGDDGYYDEDTDYDEDADDEDGTDADGPDGDGGDWMLPFN